MENMQDILKKYYASGGKDLFKEKLTEVDDTDSSGLKFNATRPKRKVDPVDMRAVTYYMDDAPFDTFQDGPTFSIEAEKEQLAPFLDNIKQRWEQDVQDGTDLEIKGRMRSNQKMFIDRKSKAPANLPTLSFTNYQTFDTNESFLLEVMMFKSMTDMNLYNQKYHPDYIKANNLKGDDVYLSKNFEYVPNSIGGDSMEPMIVVTAVSNYVEVFSAMVIIKQLAQFLRKIHTGDPSFKGGYIKLSCRGTAKDQVFKIIADKLPGVTFV